MYLSAVFLFISKIFQQKFSKTWTEAIYTLPYTIVESTAAGGYKLKDKHGHILKIKFPQTGHVVLPGKAYSSI